MSDDAEDTNLQDPEQGVESVESAAHSERLACENCRQRKVKCDRTYPCSHCAKIKVPCIYPPERKPRTKRQRVLISSIYERKIDRIAQRVEELNRSIQQLNVGRSSTTAPRASLDSPEHSHVPKSSSPSPSQETLADPSIIGEDDQNDRFKAAYEGESSLYAHAVYATSFLQCAINNLNNPSSQVALEMSSMLDALRKVADSQKQHADTIGDLYPNARPLPAGASLRDLPMPDTNKALACLRMAQDNPRVQILWLMEFQTIGQFTSYFIKVCSPGPATAAELIIVNAGLHWLFWECANVVGDEQLKQDFEEQALIVRANLETVLSRLPFHIPATLDYVYAMATASLYCLEKSKPSAAWNFICAASQLSQTIGMHSNVPLRAETADAKRQKTRLFWSIYATEKMLALRLGRSSTIRENDITVPRVGHESSPYALLNEMSPIWIAVSDLQGRVYDEIFSPGSLAQPEDVRTARAIALANEAKRLLHAQEEIHRKHIDEGSHVFGPALNELIWRAERVTGLTMLTLIYRSIRPDKSSGSVFAKDCIESARSAVMEHEKCVAILTEQECRRTDFEVYITWVLLQSPFTPFIVLFCHMIETSDPSDLHYLKNLVDMLLSVSEATSQHHICQKQLSLFKALYDVAVRYFSIKSKAAQMQGGFRDDGGAMVFNALSSCEPKVPITLPTSQAGEIPGASGPMSAPDLGGSSQMDQSLAQLPVYGSMGASFAQQGQLLSEPGMEMHSPGAELASWFYTNQQMMRMLDDM